MTPPQSLQALPASLPEADAPQSSQSLPTPSLPGFCLLAGERARLVAADPVAKKLLGEELLAASQAAPGSFLEHAFPDSGVLAQYKLAWDQPASGQATSDQFTSDQLTAETGPEATHEIQTAARCDPAKPLSLSFRSLQGEADRWVLMSLKPASAPPSSSRRDALTNLPGRERLAWQVSQLKHQSYALLFIDLNDFKQVNDQYGHAAGDSVLQTVAAQWEKCVRDNDLLIRYGGDEFVLLLPGVSRLGDAQPVVDRLQQAVSEPIAHNGVEFRLSAAIGAAIGRAGKTPLDEVLAAADRAMYANKERPR